MKKNKKNISPIAKKNVNQPGKWVFKPLRSIVVTCVCGNKYVITRKKQIECINCIYKKVMR